MKKALKFSIICVIAALTCFSCKKEKSCDPVIPHNSGSKDSIKLENQFKVNLYFDDTMKVVTLELWIQITTSAKGITIDSLTDSDSSFNNWAYVEVNDVFTASYYYEEDQLLFGPQFQPRTNSTGHRSYYLPPYSSARLTVRAIAYTDGTGSIRLHGNVFKYSMTVNGTNRSFSKNIDNFVTMDVDI
jgi:hypothetical protein